VNEKPVNLYEYEALAKELMSGSEWDFVEGGATDEITIRRTRQAFDSIMLRPRMLMDMDERDPSTTVLGEPIAFTVMLCPTCRLQHLHLCLAPRRHRRAPLIPTYGTLLARPAGVWLHS